MSAIIWSGVVSVLDIEKRQSICCTSNKRALASQDRATWLVQRRFTHAVNTARRSYILEVYTTSSVFC